MSNGNSNGGDASSVMAAGWGEGYSVLKQLKFIANNCS